MNNNISLPIYNIYDMNTYLWYSLKLCILNRNDYETWYNQHFIQLYAYDKKNYLWKLDYEDRENRNSIFDEVIETYTYKKNSFDMEMVLDAIRNYLALEHYLIIELDEYYIPEKALFHHKHFVHPVLIFGSDLQNKTFDCIGFDKCNVFGQLKICYSDIFEAIRSAENIISQEAIMFSSLKPKIKKIDYNYQFLLDGLQRYLVGEPIYKNTIKKNIEPYYGIKTYYAVSECLKQNIFDYRVFHLYAEQKRELQKKILYFNNLKDIKDVVMQMALNKYRSEVVLEFEALRKFVLKYMYKNNLNNVYEKLLEDCENSSDYRFDRDFMKSINRKLLFLKDKEEYYLNTISGQMKKYIN